MKLSGPFQISSRLMPAVQVGGAWISLELGRTRPDGRTQYRAFIDIGDEEHEITDLASGVGGGSVREGFSALLSFLGAAAESRQYRERTGQAGENEDLFPAAVVYWAAEHDDELSMLAYEIEEHPEYITE